MDITLVPLTHDDRAQFIRDNQDAFNYGALEEFGRRDDHFESEGEIISAATIEASIDNGEAYRIMQGEQKVGGVVIKVNGDRGELELLFVSPQVHSKGIGYAAWNAVEKMHPEVKLWETVTPYFEKRNIHFYINRCGFHIVEFFNSHHLDSNETDTAQEPDADGMFRFEKQAGHYKEMSFVEAVSAIPPGRYRHFKGNEYEVICIARHSESEEPMVVYKALYGDGGIWCRPAGMWNEQITRNGVTYRRFYRLDRIERVENYERLFDEAMASPDPEKLRALDAYYTSGEWREDYEADERGELPPALKRGVLSQDALYDLLETAAEQDNEV